MGDLYSIQPRWLSLRDAAAYAAIGQKRLKALAREGHVIGAPDPEDGRGGWIFDRLSLDKYREAQLGADVVATAVAQARAAMS